MGLPQNNDDGEIELDAPGVYDLNGSELSDYRLDDAGIRCIDSINVDEWKLILEEFQDDINGLDSIMVANEYSVDMYVGHSSFKDVFIDNKPVPDDLVLMIDDEYDEFMENVKHPLFNSMSEGERVRSADSDTVLEFGDYRDTEEVPMELEVINIGVPTYISYMDSVLEEFFAPGKR